jgi:hypothetical protein
MAAEALSANCQSRIAAKPSANGCNAPGLKKYGRTRISQAACCKPGLIGATLNIPVRLKALIPHPSLAGWGSIAIFKCGLKGRDISKGIIGSTALGIAPLGALTLT